MTHSTKKNILKEKFINDIETYKKICEEEGFSSDYAKKHNQETGDFDEDICETLGMLSFKNIGLCRNPNFLGLRYFFLK